MENNIGGEKRFYVGGDYVNSLGNLINYSDMCFLYKEYGDWFRVLKRIFMRVEHKLTAEEKKKINNLFLKTYEPISKYPRCEVGKLSLDLEEINYELLRMLDKYKLLINVSNKEEETL